MDFIIRKFRDDLVHMINSIDIPVEIKRLVVAEIYEELNKKSMEIIQVQMNEINNTNAKENEDGN